MTNEEYIKNLNTDDLADYIYAVYLAGIIQGKKIMNNKEEHITIDYKRWLKEDFIGILN